MENFNDSSKRLIQHQLGSLHISEFKQTVMPESERKAHIAKMSEIFINVEDKELQGMIKDQIEFAVQEAGNWEQVIFARGTINGLTLLWEKRKAESAEHLAIMNKKPEPASPSPLNTIDTNPVS